MDYGPMLADHVDVSADVSIACTELDTEVAAGTFGVVVVDQDNRVIGFEEKPTHPTEIPGKPGRVLVSMGNYVFNTDFLYKQLIQDYDDAGSSHDFGKDILPRIVDQHRVSAYLFAEPDALVDSSESDAQEPCQPYWLSLIHI